MTTYTAHYLIGDAPCGIIEMPQMRNNLAQIVRPSSIAYVCPDCGSAWGFIRISPSTRYHPVSRLCPEHGPGYMSHFRLDDYPAPREAIEWDLRRSSGREAGYVNALLFGGRL